jgi:hypothetical protein
MYTTPVLLVANPTVLAAGKYTPLVGAVLLVGINLAAVEAPAVEKLPAVEVPAVEKLPAVADPVVAKLVPSNVSALVDVATPDPV